MSATSIGLRGGRDDAKDEEDEDPFSDSMADFLTAIADTDDEDENAEKAARPRQPPSHEDDATTEIGSHQARAPEPAGPAVGAGQAEEHGMSEHENNAGAAVAEPEILPSNFINVPARGLYGEGPVNGDAMVQGEEEEEEEEVQSGADAGIDLASIRAVAKEEVERGHILDDILGPTSVAEGELHREDVGKGLDAFVVEGLVDSEEAAALIRATESLGFSFWNPCSNRTDYRNSDTIEVTNQRLADALYARVRHLVPPRVTISPGNARWSKELEGEWVAVGINPVMLFNRYGPGGHFSPHTDGYTIVDFNTRSMYSTLVYLNDCPDGGATRMMEESGDATDKECFVKDGAGRIRYEDARVRASVSPATGRALFFFQDTLHEGEPLGAGMSKYIIRTDVLYERSPRRYDAPRDREAYRLFREAELAECHAPERALAMYMRVRALSPELAAVYGLE